MLTPLSSLAVRKKNVTFWKALGILSFGYTRAELESTLLESARLGATNIWDAAFIALGSRTSPEVWRDSMANAALSGNLGFYQSIEERMLTHSYCRDVHLSLDRILAGAVESGSIEMVDYIVRRRPKALKLAFWRGLMCSALRSRSSAMMDYIFRLTPPKEVENFEWFSLASTAVNLNDFAAVDWVCRRLEFRDVVDWNLFAGYYTGGDNAIQQRLNKACERVYFRRSIYGIKPAPQVLPQSQPQLLLTYSKAA